MINIVLSIINIYKFLLRKLIYISLSGGIFLSNLIFSFNVIMPIFLVMSVGYFSKKIGLINENFINLAIKFNFRVGLSTLLFYEIYSAKVSKSWDMGLLLFAFLSIIASATILWIVIPIFIKNKKKLRL